MQKKIAGPCFFPESLDYDTFSSGNMALHSLIETGGDLIKDNTSFKNFLTILFTFLVNVTTGLCFPFLFNWSLQTYFAFAKKCCSCLPDRQKYRLLPPN